MILFHLFISQIDLSRTQCLFLSLLHFHDQWTMNTKSNFNHSYFLFQRTVRSGSNFNSTYSSIKQLPYYCVFNFNLMWQQTTLNHNFNPIQERQADGWTHRLENIMPFSEHNKINKFFYFDFVIMPNIPLNPSEQTEHWS